MSSATTDTANDVRCKVTLFGTVVFTVADSTAVLADLVFIVSEGTVERCQLPQLVSLVIVLAFRGRGSLQI